MSGIQFDDPVVPGEAAAGVRLGISERELLPLLDSSFSREQGNDQPPIYSQAHVKYSSSDVVVWLRSGKVGQVGVRGRYTGKLLDRYRVGCFATELAELGEIGEDDEDNPVIRGLSGFCFEAFPPKGIERFNFNVWRVEWFFVFEQTEQQWGPLG